MIEQRGWGSTRRRPDRQPIVLRGACVDSAATLSPDGELLATGGRDNTVQLWNLADVNPTADVRVLKGHDADITRARVQRRCQRNRQRRR